MAVFVPTGLLEWEASLQTLVGGSTLESFAGHLTCCDIALVTLAMARVPMWN
jgi:hypothetical protein